MRTFNEIRKEAAQKYKEGMAVVDLKFNEVFRFSFQTDAQVVVEWPNMFRPANEREAIILEESGESSVSLDQ
jgi:hypothetical protein